MIGGFRGGDGGTKANFQCYKVSSVPMEERVVGLCNPLKIKEINLLNQHPQKSLLPGQPLELKKTHLRC